MDKPFIIWLICGVVIFLERMFGPCPGIISNYGCGTFPRNLIIASGPYLSYDVGPARAFLGEAEKTPWLGVLGPASRVKPIHDTTPLGKNDFPILTI